MYIAVRTCACLLYSGVTMKLTGQQPRVQLVIIKAPFTLSCWFSGGCHEDVRYKHGKHLIVRILPSPSVVKYILVLVPLLLSFVL